MVLYVPGLLSDVERVVVVVGVGESVDPLLIQPLG